ncbi:hypothetical protein QR680_008780 [Steinernema hermaphroditum]|uniref:Transcription factor IIIC subunit 5 HTH domain-containing protein n=1 Tax=Steinernema hermaphroditum TaxID=289476 RepID=A0AA39M8A6_9BILA|nr:hypothetical protein QR680_008780 [Steinernema hermaphroditum]
MSPPSTEEPTAPEFVLIQYPGIVKNPDKALETLGGLSQISQAHNAGRNFELRYRPANPYHYGITSERINENKFTSGALHLVVKIRRHKKNKANCKAEILGLASTVYRFKSICDFQYLPVRRTDSNSDVCDDLVPRMVPDSIPSALSWWESAEDGFQTPLFLPPYLYSRYNTPSTKILCRETDFSEEKQAKRSGGHGINLRMERKSLAITVRIDEDFPSAPTPEAVQDADFRCKNEEPHKVIKMMFDERPMWTKVAILCRTGLDEPQLKYLLQKYAFYVQNGAWGRLWCKFGYDPRTKIESAPYQTLMVSFRQHGKIPEKVRLKVAGDRTLAGTTAESSEVFAHLPIVQEQPKLGPDDHLYIPGTLPKLRQMWYSLCDVNLPIAEEALKRSSFARGDRADHTSGWFSAELLDSVRRAIKEDVRKTSAQLDADTEVDISHEWDSDEF